MTLRHLKSELIELGILVLAASTILCAPAYPLDLARELRDARERTALQTIADLCRARGTCPNAIEVVVESQRNMHRGVLAHTTRFGDRCLVHLTEASAADEHIVAHEVCHCIGDFPVLGPYGYEGIAGWERALREKKAETCGRQLRRNRRR